MHKCKCIEAFERRAGLAIHKQLEVISNKNSYTTKKLKNDTILKLKQYSSTLSHQGAVKKASPVKAGSHNLDYHINDLNAEKNPSPAVT